MQPVYFRSVARLSGIVLQQVQPCKFAGLARTIHTRCIYGVYGREVTKYKVICNVYVRLWATL